jgi:uncharacterized ubiquitin-like protein YukD
MVNMYQLSTSLINYVSEVLKIINRVSRNVVIRVTLKKILLSEPNTNMIEFIDISGNEEFIQYTMF